jgi:hypothetical protein
MDQWKKNGIDNFIIKIKKFYEDSSLGYFGNQGIIDKLNEEELEYFNSIFNLSDVIGVNSEFVLEELLKSKEKRNFFSYILGTKIFRLEIDYFEKTNKTLFIRIIESYFDEKDGFLIHCICNLFERGYEIKNEDVKFISDLYKKIKTQKQLENWLLLRSAVKLKNFEKFRIIIQKQKELYTIFSLKLNKPVGYNFPNLLGVLSNALNFYRENGELFLCAMEEYQRTDAIMQLDLRKGNFKRKLEEFEVNKPIQDKEFREIIGILLPELK